MNRSSIIKSVVPLFLLILGPGQTSHAQLRPGNLTAYKERDGLPGMDVNSLVMDRYGYLWVGTINGIGRFDGYQFQRYYFDPNDSSTVHGLVTWSLFEDRRGYIWAGTSPSFLNRYDPATRSFKQYPFKQLFPDKSGIEIDVTGMKQDSRGRLYFGMSTYYGDTISHALLYMDEGDSALHVFPVPAGDNIDNVSRIQMAPDGVMWVLCYSGLRRLDPSGRMTRFNMMDAVHEKGEWTVDFVIDRNGHVVELTSRSRLIDHDPATGIHKEWTLHPGGTEWFSRLLEDRDGGLWVGFLSGLVHFDRGSGRMDAFPAGEGGEKGPLAIKSLLLDTHNDLWIGSGKDGLMRYSEESRLRSLVHQKGQQNSLTSGWASILTEMSDGKLAVATGGIPTESGLNLIDPLNWSVRSTTYASMGFRASGLSGIWESEPGKLVMNVFSLGLYEFTPATSKVRKIHLAGLPDSVVLQRRMVDSRGDEWIGSASHGVYRRQRGATAFTNYDLLSFPGTNLSSNAVSMTVNGPKHGVWLLTDNGLFLFDPKTEKITRHGYDRTKGDVFISQDINSLYEDSSGIVWVGTWQGGLSRYDMASGKIKTYTRNDGLPSNSIQGILADEKRQVLWLSTFEGLSRMDVRTGQFSNYSLDDGIQSQLFADGAQMRTSKGVMVFGGSNGVTVFHPDSIDQRSFPPKVLLTDLRLFNKIVLPGKGSLLTRPISETDSIVLPHDQNNITLEYVALHFANPSMNRYAYKLENYEADWREVGSQRVAFYPSLPPGHYVFRVKAANDKGIWNEKGATLHITILPPWWRTTWAYILYGLLLALLAFGLDRYFRARIVEKERERNQARELEQAREIQKAYSELGKAHEELKSTQTQLVHAEKMASLGELTAGIAHEIQNPLNFVNNFAEINRDLIVEVFDAQSRGDVDEVQTLLGDIRDNEGKIRHHGLRADAIVKSMLQHSRASTGQKEPTDLAALSDEYLKLAYHGMRAKDKAFNVTMETDFEAGLPKVNVIPQDIGRVLLNLYNNAFQAVMERKKSGESGYEPKVRVEVRGVGSPHAALSSQDAGGQSGRQSAAVHSESGIRNPEWVRIAVSDNGPGIPEAIRTKIFQPFFTTKPTGQGTGLGLSLSYDIVTKGHGGDLQVESKEGEGARFIVTLPVQS